MFCCFTIMLIHILVFHNASQCFELFSTMLVYVLSCFEWDAASLRLSYGAGEGEWSDLIEDQNVDILWQTEFRETEWPAHRMPSHRNTVSLLASKSLETLETSWDARSSLYHCSQLPGPYSFHLPRFRPVLSYSEPLMINNHTYIMWREFRETTTPL